MMWIDWISIFTNRCFVSELFDFRFAIVMTVLAQRLQFAIPEIVLVSIVRLDVIGHLCSND